MRHGIRWHRCFFARPMHRRACALVVAMGLGAALSGGGVIPRLVAEEWSPAPGLVRGWLEHVDPHRRVVGIRLEGVSGEAGYLSLRLSAHMPLPAAAQPPGTGDLPRPVVFSWRPGDTPRELPVVMEWHLLPQPRPRPPS
ncbi:MAG: hypothetical protein H7831_12455 [Magnetococcus sp. WYHC-3]